MPGLFFITVFFEGVASFLSPCVLPLIPAYMTYMTGQSVEAACKDKRTHRTLIVNSLAFILGFTIIFVLLGAAATSVGTYLLRNQNIIRKISGIMIILFGLFQMGIIPIKILNYEKRLHIQPKNTGFLQSLLIGIGFSIGWTPCIGPILTSVLILAASTQTLVSGILLLTVYSLGLGLPFFLMAVGIRVLWKYIKGLYKYMRIIKVVSGLVLVVIGVMIYYNAFYFLSYY